MIACGVSCFTLSAAIKASSAETVTLCRSPAILIPTVNSRVISRSSCRLLAGRTMGRPPQRVSLLARLPACWRPPRRRNHARRGRSSRACRENKRFASASHARRSSTRLSANNSSQPNRVGCRRPAPKEIQHSLANLGVVFYVCSAKSRTEELTYGGRDLADYQPGGVIEARRPGRKWRRKCLKRRDLRKKTDRVAKQILMSESFLSCRKMRLSA